MTPQFSAAKDPKAVLPEVSRFDMEDLKNDYSHDIVHKVKKSTYKSIDRAFDGPSQSQF